MTYTQEILNHEHLSTQEQERLHQYQAALPGVQRQILDWKHNGTLPLLALPENEAITHEIAELATSIRNHSKGMVVLGTGGSSLGGKTLCTLAEGDYPVHFIENLDPHTMQHFMNHENMAELHLVIVSKSGSTMETLTQAMILLGEMERKLGRNALADRCHAITMPGARGLRELAERYGIPVLDHDPDVGGRFSVLSNVGLLPAAAAGVDIAAIQHGAAGVLALLADKADCVPLLGAAWQAALMPARTNSVLMPYCDRLRLFGDWFRQLWAESLGKDGHGSTPAAALGAVDQHSQLQLYLDGPKDKCFTLVTLPHDGQGPVIPQPPMEAFGYIGGKTIGDAMAALQHGTIETIRRKGLPLRLLKLKQLDEHTLGALLMHYMLETMAVAQLIGINAFDQPAVEESKNLAREALSGKASRAA